MAGKNYQTGQRKDKMTNKNTIIKEFITSFLSIYNVDEIKNLTINNNEISGQIIWYDADTDDADVYFKWKIDISMNILTNLTEMLEYILEQKLYYSDIITIPIDKLIEVFENKGWSKDKVQNTFYQLMDIEVDRYENNEKVNAFFIHQ